MRTTVDCFCGAGGLSCGLAAAGLHVSLGIDCDERALSVYRANHSHPAVSLDLANVPHSVETIRTVVGPHIDCLL